jgi:UMF1 family MFS transporter
VTTALGGARRREIPVTSREIFGWAMFDFANSAHTTVVITAVYNAFFVGFIVAGPGGDSYWSTAIVLSMLVTIVLSPLVGAIIDFSGKKKRYLVASCLVCSLATGSLFFVDPGEIWLGIALVVTSSVGFMLSEAFCASFLPEIATPRNMGKVSGLGWGIGYFGGLASAFVALRLVITSDPVADPGGYVRDNQLAMLVTGAFFLIAALPTFLLVKNRSLPVPGFERARAATLVRAGIAELRQSVATARRHPILFRFLVAFMVYMAGLDAIVKFFGIYAREEIHLTTAEFTTLFLVLQVSAALGAFGFGWLEGRIGPKRTVLWTLIWWIVGVTGILMLDPLSRALQLDPKVAFNGLGLIAGAGIGATQASSRTVVGLLAPADRSAQMFGFWSMFQRLGSILGAGMGYVNVLLGTRRAGVVLVLMFFVVGAVLLSRIDVDRGIREAQHP